MTANLPGTGSGAGGVSSFNTRTGAVTLAKSDVTATGLTFSDVNAQPAAKRFYVVETYGAKVDGKVVQDGAMTNGSPTLTCATSAPFVIGDIGKQITVAGAGAAGVVLVTTISGFTSASVVTLAANASATVSAKQVIYGTNDTTAWRNAFIDIGTAGQGIAYCSRVGISLLNSAMEGGGGGGLVPGVVVLPNLTAPNKFLMPIVGIEGPSPPGMPFSEMAGFAAVDTTSALVLMANGSEAQLSTTGTPVGNVISTGITGGFNDLCFWGKNFIVRTPVSSAYQALDVRGAQQAILEDVGCDIQTPDMTTMVTPQGGNVGVWLPQNNNGALTKVDRVFAIGYSTNFILGEHTEASHLNAGYGQVAYAIDRAYHSIHVGRAVAQWNNHVLKSVGAGLPFTAPIRIDLLDIEDGGGSWTPVDHISDSGNLLVGEIAYARVAASVGNKNGLTVVGGRNVLLRDIFAPAGGDRDRLPNWVGPFDPHMLTAATVAALGSNTVFAVRVVVPRDGVLHDLGAYIGTQSGNCRIGVYDTGDASAGNRTRLYDSGSVATPAGGAFRVIADPSLKVYAGQQLDLALVFDNASASAHYLPVSSASTNMQLPANFWGPPVGGATAKLAWNNSPGSFTLPATVSEAGCALTNSQVCIFGRIAQA